MRILVIKLSSLGDILHVLPAVHELRVQLKAEIDWVVHPEFAALVRCFADVDHVLTFPRRHLFRDIKAAVAELRRTKYDLVVDLHGLFKSGIVARLARADRRLAPSYAREGSSIFFGEKAKAPDGSGTCTAHDTRHAVERAYDSLTALGLQVPKTFLRAELRPADNRQPTADKSHSQPLKRPDAQTLIAFAPVSRWQSKDWPLDKFGAVAKKLITDMPGAQIVILGGKNDVAAGETIIAAAGKDAASRLVNLCGKTSIAESLQLLSKADLLIANDTGPVHMAAAVGTHCLVIFGPTREDWTGPYGSGHRVISHNIPCRPCLKRKCPRGDHACMVSITPEEVCAAAREMMGSVPLRGVLS